MPEVTIYTTRICPYCSMAKGLLRRKNVGFQEIDVGNDQAKREAMVARSQGRRTVPQIFIGQTHVGGCDDLHDLERQGRLDQMLMAS